MPIIALITDFGTRDWYVASMKGALLGIAPQATVVDITHEIAPGDVRSAAYVLLSTFRDFPQGAIFVGVVDPGVGSDRRGIAARCGGYLFVGPDNGILSRCLGARENAEVRSLTNPAFQRHPASQSFHGRDIFAPAAAHLAVGVPLESFGPLVTDCVMLDAPAPRAVDGEIRGEVVYIDRFGNAITNIPLSRCGGGEADRRVVIVKGQECPVADHYDAVPRAAALGVAGSSGYLEVSVNGGSAAEVLKLTAGDPVSLR
jgi:S-adenosyl-L-methionine hydrolase (adenosine-forming)